MDEKHDLLEIRSNFYAFLYRMYLEEPPRELAADMVSGTFPMPSDVSSLDDDLRVGFELLKKYMKNCKDTDEVHERLRDEHTRLFIGPGASPVPPYESMYVDGKMRSNALLEVKQVYRESGVGKQNYPEPEDHIAFELRFMHHLCENGELGTQRRFMDKHLMRWVPRFCDDLFASEHSDFYKGIAKITKGFLAFDSAVIDELPD